MKYRKNSDGHVSDWHIEELLNAYLDGELTQREQVEVQRLMKHDPEIARRLRRLQKCKMLVSSLPRAEAPSQMLERVKTALQTKQVLGEPVLAFQSRDGSRGLFVRRLVAAAAMFLLLAVLAVVVYTILAPERIEPATELAKDNSTSRPVATNAVKELSEPFYGRLELQTSDFAAVDAAINKAIADNGLTEAVNRHLEAGKSIYTIDCGRRNFKMLLAELSRIWNRLDSARLIVETDRFGQEVIVANVLPEQISEIVGIDSLQKRVAAAKKLAELNHINQLTCSDQSGNELYSSPADIIAIPKPLLTGGRRDSNSQKELEVEDQQHLRMTIVLEK